MGKRGLPLQTQADAPPKAKLHASDFQTLALCCWEYRACGSNSGYKAPITPTRQPGCSNGGRSAPDAAQDAAGAE